MDEFILYLLRFGQLNQQQIDFIISRTKELKLRKGDYFLEAGKIPRQAAFIVEGVLRVCYYNNKGEEITKYFIDEKNLVVDYFNFIGMTSAAEYGQAVTDCKLLVLEKENWDELSSTIVSWEAIVNKIVQNALRIKLERTSSRMEQDATTRYLEFIKKFPQMANRVPLSYVASYLGITQQSLSRIRKNIR